jgi:hypothetical protein
MVFQYLLARVSGDLYSKGLAMCIKNLDQAIWRKSLIFEFFGCMFWVTGYIHTAINDGPGCLSLRCADPPCEAIVGEDLVYDLVSEDDRRKYSRYLLRSYVEDNRKVRFFCCLFMCWIHRGWDTSKNEVARSLADWVCKLLVGARTLNIGTLVCPFLSGLD